MLIIKTSSLPCATTPRAMNLVHPNLRDPAAKIKIGLEFDLKVKISFQQNFESNPPWLKPAVFVFNFSLPPSTFGSATRISMDLELVGRPPAASHRSSLKVSKESQYLSRMLFVESLKRSSLVRGSARAYSDEIRPTNAITMTLRMSVALRLFMRRIPVPCPLQQGFSQQVSPLSFPWSARSAGQRDRITRAHRAWPGSSLRSCRR